MTVDVRLRPEAEQALAETAGWYEEQRPGLGQEFLDEALRTFAAIAERPLASAAVYGSLRRALLHRFPLAPFTSLTATEPVVIDVIHGSRHPAGGRAGCRPTYNLNSRHAGCDGWFQFESPTSTTSGRASAVFFGIAQVRAA